MNAIILFSAILNKSDSRSRKSYSTIDCDSDDDSDEDIFNDIYADLNDLEEFQDESTEVEVRDRKCLERSFSKIDFDPEMKILRV